MNLQQIIYASQPFGFDQAGLNGILVEARHYNTLANVTGALICRSDLYLQLLEGPQDKVMATYDRICKDDRHVNIKLLRSTLVKERMFPDWAMRDDPAQSWMWTREEIAANVLNSVSAQDALGVFKRLAEAVA